MWLIEREKKMEAIVKKKIELQRVREQTAVFDEMERKKKLEKEVLDQLVKKKKFEDSDLLQKALDRADHLVLNNAVNSENFADELKAEYAELALKGSAKNAEDKEKKAQIVKQLDKIRQQDFKTEQADRVKDVRTLKQKQKEMES